ncbi:MAG: ABC transporter ATP-binding protein [Desulfobacteraceae bacterium]|nr:ABC transporter ATP-binding protein [Desulfobacteraceae bacterium]
MTASFPNTAPPILAVENLRTTFRTERGPLTAVDGVTFSLGEGRALGVVGESGCGKSVLCRTLLGLLPPTARVDPAARVRFYGKDLLGGGASALRRLRGREISMILQNPMSSLNPVMTVGAQAAEPLRVHTGMSRKRAWKRAVSLLAAVGIPRAEERMKQYPHHFSGGMRQRVAIAMALACGPRLLLADEPTTALDVTVQAEILDLLAVQRRTRRMALILVSHDLGVVAGRTDEVAVMYAGKIVEHAPTPALFANPRMPYSRALLESIPVLDNAPHTRLRAIGGSPPDGLELPYGCRFAPRCSRVQPRCLQDEPGLDFEGAAPHGFACWNPFPLLSAGRQGRNGPSEWRRT